MGPEFLEIGGRRIGKGYPVYVIAELSANHGHSLERALELIAAAKYSGANAIKVQTYTAETITLDCDNEHFRIRQGTIWDGQRLFDLYAAAHLPWDWHAELQAAARELGMDFFSTPFDPSAVDFLEQLHVPAYKIASFELVDTPLLEAIGRTGRPVIMSTGMSSADEIGEALETLRRSGSGPIALLKCTSAYPAPAESMNLATLVDMSKRFAVPVGLSDHTLSHESAIAAVALGAVIVEKHLTLRRSDGGPDAAFSLEPGEFADLVQALRRTEAAMGEVLYGPSSYDQGNRAFRKSLFAAENIAAGEPFTASNVRSVRPAAGLPPKFLKFILGRPARQSISKGTPLSWELVDSQGDDPAV